MRPVVAAGVAYRGTGFGPVAVTIRCGTQPSTWWNPSNTRPASRSTDAWAVTRAGLDLGLARVIGAVLVAVTIGAFALAALATVGVLVPAGWSQPAIALGAVASAATLVLFFDPQLVLGRGIDAVLLWVVASRAWVS